jgi:hypothetical protein
VDWLRWQAMAASWRVRSTGIDRSSSSAPRPVKVVENSLLSVLATLRGRAQASTGSRKCRAAHRADSVARWWSGVAGDAAFVEHQQRGGVDVVGDAADVGGQLVDGLGVEATVAVVEQFEVCDAEDGAGGVEFGGADRAEVAVHAVEGGGLAVGEAKHAEPAAGVGEVGEHGAKPEGLVVGVGAHEERARCVRVFVGHAAASLVMLRT